MIYVKKDELYHFGIFGMKWGVRRYQNKDGSLTEEGKKHYGNYKESQTRQKAVNKEYNKLWDKHSKVLTPELGGRDQVDDIDTFDIVIEDLGLDAKSYFDAKASYYKFTKENADSIKIGKEISKKIFKK